jgi:hypothetical protein
VAGIEAAIEALPDQPGYGETGRIVAMRWLVKALKRCHQPQEAARYADRLAAILSPP